MYIYMWINSLYTRCTSNILLINDWSQYFVSNHTLISCDLYSYLFNFFGNIQGIFANSRIQTLGMTIHAADQRLFFIFFLWVYFYNRKYFSIIYLHRDPISTKATLQLIFLLYEDIIEWKKEKEREEGKMGHLMYSICFHRRGIIYYLKLVIKSLPESVVFIISTIFQK